MPHQPSAMSRPCWLLMALLGTAPAHGDLRVSGRSLLLPDSATPHLLRAVLYSPTPWGADGRLSDAAESTVWMEVFERDLALMNAMGVNALRLPGFFTSSIESSLMQGFLDAAASHNITVLVTYEMQGVALGSFGNIIADGGLQLDVLRAFIDSLNSHPAVGMILLGERGRPSPHPLACLPRRLPARLAQATASMRQSTTSCATLGAGATRSSTTAPASLARRRVAKRGP